MKCRYCGYEMRLVDVDKNFKGNEDRYYICDTCNSGCIEEIRYNKPFREIWHLEIDSFVFDDIIDPSSFRSPVRPLPAFVLDKLKGGY